LKTNIGSGLYLASAQLGRSDRVPGSGHRPWQDADRDPGDRSMRRLAASLLTLALLLAMPQLAAAASPTVTTLSATGIGQKSATLRGDVNPHGIATTYAFQYGTTNAYGAQTSSHAAGTGTTSKTVSLKVGGLTPGTTYHYRVIAANADGTTTGADRAFKTTLPAPKPPLVLATAPFSPSANGVTFTALLNPNAATTTYRFQYGTSTAYGLETFGKTLAAGVVPRPVQFTLGSLASHTTYHFRVVASNSAGTTFGPDTLAQTGPFPPGALSTRTRPGHARRSHPFFVTTGSLKLGPGVSVAQGCSGGTITVRFTSGRHTVARAHTTLRPGHCSFHLRMRVLPARGVHRLRVRTTFGGNAILTPIAARTYLVQIG
jgi:hypothetical protein